VYTRSLSTLQLQAADNSYVSTLTAGPVNRLIALRYDFVACRFLALMISYPLLIKSYFGKYLTRRTAYILSFSGDNNNHLTAVFSGQPG